MRTRALAVCCGLVLLTGACSESIQAPAEPAREFASSFMNGPAELPNVFRADYRWAVAIADPETELVVVAGFPADPRTRIACGGTERPEFHPFQDAGQIQEVIHTLMNDPETNLHVYDRADIPNNAAFCTAMWIGSGTGRFMYTDNDGNFSGTRTNTWAFQMRGDVEMVDGSGPRKVNGFQHLMIVNGEFRVLSSRVTLN